jgi:hypothetical protein
MFAICKVSVPRLRRDISVRLYIYGCLLIGRIDYNNDNISGVGILIGGSQKVPILGFLIVEDGRNH